jgi:hypothetical protein
VVASPLDELIVHCAIAILVVGYARWDLWEIPDHRDLAVKQVQLAVREATVDVQVQVQALGADHEDLREWDPGG